MIRLNADQQFLSYPRFIGERARLDTSRNSERKFVGRVWTDSQDVRSAQQVPVPFSLFHLSSFYQRFTSTLLNSLLLSLSLCFLRSLAICKPTSSTGVEDVRTCYAVVCVLESCIYAWHIVYICTYMHKWEDEEERIGWSRVEITSRVYFNESPRW